jgi:hypothetical protein
MALDANDQLVVGAVADADVQQTLAGLRPFAQSAKWLGPRNRYVEETVEQIKNELSGGGSIVRPRQLAQYIAASSVLHCADAWGYLGRALSALSCGDPHRCLHLAYYAELRAAMSLLASAGVGAFRDRHFAITAKDQVTVLNDHSNTHPFVWFALEYWSGLSRSGTAFAKWVAPEGRPLDNWLYTVGGGAAVAAQAKDWFRQWGMDLSLARLDRDARNESSYRPDGLPSAWSVDPAEALTYVADFWRSIRPGPNFSFPEVDREILRLSLESIFRGRYGVEPSQNLGAFRTLVEGVVRAENIGAAREPLLIDYLCRQSNPDDHVLFRQSSLRPVDRKSRAYSVLSRATLLSRIATGASAGLLTSAGFSAKSIGFWINQLGNARGYWSGSIATEALDDLWADISDLVGDIDEFQAAHAGQSIDLDEVIVGLGGVLRSSGNCERVAIMALALS